MKNFPELETERLVLKKLRRIDLHTIVKYASDKDISKYTLNIPYPYATKDAIWWIKFSEHSFEDNTRYIFGIFFKETDKFIGGIDIQVPDKNMKANLGYWIAKQFWNKGIMTEALKRILKFGFEELKINKIYALHLIENVASGKVMQKVGMVKEGVFADHNYSKGKFRTVVQYRMLRREYDILNTLKEL